MAPTLKDDVLLRARLADHITVVENSMKLAQQAAEQLGYDDVALELKRIHREIIIGIEDMIYTATVRLTKQRAGVILPDSQTV